MRYACIGLAFVFGLCKGTSYLCEFFGIFRLGMSTCYNVGGKFLTPGGGKISVYRAGICFGNFLGDKFFL